MDTSLDTVNGMATWKTTRRWPRLLTTVVLLTLLGTALKQSPSTNMVAGRARAITATTSVTLALQTFSVATTPNSGIISKTLENTHIAQKSVPTAT